MFSNLMKRKLPVRVSELVENQINDKYPGLKKNSIPRFSVKNLHLIPVSTLIVIIFFLISLGLNEFLVSRGTIIATYSLTTESASAILISYFEYLAILIGIVIPVVLFIVPYVEGIGLSSIMNIYMDRIGVKRTAILAVIVLAIELFAVWFVSADLMPDAKFQFYFTLFFTLINLTVLLETGHVVTNVIRMVNTKSLVDVLLEKLRLEAKKSQFIEARYRLKRLATVNLYKLLHIKKVPDFFQPSDQIPLSLPLSGLIQDIDVSSLTQLLSMLQHQAIGLREEKILVTRVTGDYIHMDQALAYISINESTQSAEIQKLLQKAFITRKPTQDSEELQNLLEQIKNRTEYAIRGNDEGLFEKMMGAYAFLFDLYIDLPLPPSADPFPELFRGWSAIAIANLHLNEIIKTASSLGNDQIISRLAYEIYQIAAMIISRTDEHLNESFADVLRLFVTMYYVSYNAGNKTGMSQSFYNLTGSLVDRIWTRKLQNVRNNLQIVQNLRAVLEIILRTQAELIRDMVRNQDVKNFLQLLKKMNPNEQLAYFNTVLPDSGERYRLQNALRTTSPEQSIQIEQRLDALNIIECIPKEIGAFFTELHYVIASYLVEGYEQHEFTSEYTNQILRIIQQNGSFQSFPKSLELLLELTGPVVTFIKWDWFNRHPDTKQVYSPDDERKYLLFYCLNGISFLAHQPEISSLPVNDIQGRLPRIKQICKQIIDSSSTWQLILGIEAKQIEQLAENFANVNQKISEAWKADRENKIIAIDLDPQKIEIFVKKVVTTIESAQGLRSLLQNHGRFNKAPRVPGKLIWEINNCATDKEDFTTLSHGTNLIEDSGSYYGSNLVQLEKDKLIHLCVASARSVQTRKDWTTLEPYFSTAINELRQGGYQASLILAPYNLLYGLFENLRGFENRYTRSDTIPGLRGYYQDIPIVDWHFSEVEPLLLFWDMTQALQLDVEEPIIEVKPLSTADRARIHLKAPQIEERKLLLSIKVKVAEKVHVTWLDRRSLLKLRLKLPESNYFKIDL